MAVTVRLFAAAREAFGSTTVEVPAGTVREVCDAVIAAAEEQRRSKVAAVLAMSVLLGEGIRYRAADDAILAEGSVVDVLPPFAGG